MKTSSFTFLAVLIILGAASLASGQKGSRTYSETRKLLAKMETSHANGAFRKLFNEGDERRADLADLLYDSEKQISLNAQTVFKYMADPLSLETVERWYAYRRRNFAEYWSSPVDLVSETKFLTGADQDLAALVLQNFYANDPDVWARQIGLNKPIKTVVVELIFGQVFTEGWHIVIKNENGRWRLVSHTLIWQS